MQNLQINDITTLFVVVDDCLPKKQIKVGRPTVLSESEMITILLWGTLFLRAKNIKTIYNFFKFHEPHYFHCLPDYSSFVPYCIRITPVITQLIQNSFDTDSPLQFVDSTMLQFCKLVRSDRHRTAKGIATYGKNHQGWHYGFKLHATVNLNGQICGILFTPASFHDAQALPYLIRGKVKIVVGDGGYNASVMRSRMWKENGTFILAPPHPKQKTKLMAKWQHKLLKMRPKVESVFGILKEHLHLVSSFPRSIAGYMFHYALIILAYQFMIAF